MKWIFYIPEKPRKESSRCFYLTSMSLPRYKQITNKWIRRISIENLNWRARAESRPRFIPKKIRSVFGSETSSCHFSIACGQTPLHPRKVAKLIDCFYQTSSAIMFDCLLSTVTNWFGAHSLPRVNVQTYRLDKIARFAYQRAHEISSLGEAYYIRFADSELE